MHYITDVKSLDSYILELTFEDGCIKKVDIKKFLDGDQWLFSRIKGVFDQVYINVVDAIEWPGEISLCSDVMYTEGVDVKGSNKQLNIRY